LEVLDYIRITALADIEVISSDIFDVTFNIIYSQESDFSRPLRGVFTLRLSEFINMATARESEVENMALGLVGQILMRGKKDDGSVCVLHLFGIGLGNWLAENAKRNMGQGALRT